MESAKTVYDLLSSGGWLGLIALVISGLIIAVIYLYREQRKDDAKLREACDEFSRKNAELSEKFSERLDAIVASSNSSQHKMEEERRVEIKAMMDSYNMRYESLQRELTLRFESLQKKNQEQYEELSKDTAHLLAEASAAIKQNSDLIQSIKGILDNKSC